MGACGALSDESGPPDAVIAWSDTGIGSANSTSITFCSGRNGADLAAVSPGKRRRTQMDREHVKGTADKAKGAIKDAAGKMTGDKELQSEGKMDKAKGSAHKAAGDVKDAVKNATE